MDTSAAPVVVPIGMPAARDATAAASPHRWIVAVTSRKASAGSVLRTAVDDGARDGGAVMKLVPAHRDADEYLTEIGFFETCRPPQVWAMPRSGDLAALVSHHPDVDHRIITTGDDTALIDALIADSELAEVTAHLELPVLPRPNDRRRTYESSASGQIPLSTDRLVDSSAPGHGLGVAGVK